VIILRSLALLFVAIAAIVAGGCATLVDTDAMRLCRTLIPVLDHDGARIDVLDTVETRPDATGAFAVAIDYVVPASPVILRRLSCSFATAAWSTPAAGIDALRNVTTVDGDIGPIRLWLLKKHWLESGEAAAADPAPFATLWRLPDVPRPAATLVQVLLSSLPIIAVYALLAAAYALLYGLVGRINLAFGEMTMLAGYAAFLGYVVGMEWGTVPALIAGLLIGVATAVIHGTALGRLVLSPLAHAPGQHLLIATLGIAIAWSELLRLTQGNGNRWMPPLLNRPLALLTSGDMTVTLTPMAVTVAVTAMLATLCLAIAMRSSPFGRRWRAVADDAMAARFCGIDPARIMLQTIVVTGLLAGLAGILTTAYYGGVGFSGGLATALKALVAAVLGGIANPLTAIVGGVVLGLAEASWSAVFPIETRDPAIFLLLALTLALKPEGLFTRR